MMEKFYKSYHLNFTSLICSWHPCYTMYGVRWIAICIYADKASFYETGPDVHEESDKGAWIGP